MMALAWTYFPPTCWMTSAYSFSAPTATILPSAVVVSSAKEDEQPAASRAAPARAASAASLLRPFGIAGFSQVQFGVVVASNDNDSQFWLQRGSEESGGHVWQACGRGSGAGSRGR